MFYCEPAWHDGDKAVPAAVVIRPLETSHADPGFASCERDEHIGRALKTVLARNPGGVRVRDVTGRMSA